MTTEATSERFNLMDSAAELVRRVPEGKSGDVEVRHFDVTKDEAAWGNLLAAKNGHADAEVSPGRYVKLLVASKVMMSNTQMEARTNSSLVHWANGDVLIGGLGLGMILHALADRDASERKPWQAGKIRSVTVIEQSEHVIELVAPHLPTAFPIKVVRASVFDWRPPKGAKYQTMYWDIWAESSTDDLEEMAALNRRYARNFNRNAAGSFRSAWRIDELRYQKQRDKRMGW